MVLTTRKNLIANLDRIENIHSTSDGIFTQLNKKVLIELRIQLR